MAPAAVHLGEVIAASRQAVEAHDALGVRGTDARQGGRRRAECQEPEGCPRATRGAGGEPSAGPTWDLALANVLTHGNPAKAVPNNLDHEARDVDLNQVGDGRDVSDVLDVSDDLFRDGNRGCVLSVLAGFSFLVGLDARAFLGVLVGLGFLFVLGFVLDVLVVLGDLLNAVPAPNVVVRLGFAGCLVGIVRNIAIDGDDLTRLARAGALGRDGLGNVLRGIAADQSRSTDPEDPVARLDGVPRRPLDGDLACEDEHEATLPDLGFEAGDARVGIQVDGLVVAAHNLGTGDGIRDVEVTDILGIGSGTGGERAGRAVGSLIVGAVDCDMVGNDRVRPTPSRLVLLLQGLAGRCVRVVHLPLLVRICPVGHRVAGPQRVSVPEVRLNRRLAHGDRVSLVAEVHLVLARLVPAPRRNPKQTDIGNRRVAGNHTQGEDHDEDGKATADAPRCHSDAGVTCVHATLLVATVAERYLYGPEALRCQPTGG